MYIAFDNGHDKVVQLLLDHGAQVDVPDKVSEISYIHINLYNTAEVNEIIGDIINGQKMICLYYHCSAVVVLIIIYQYSIFNKSCSFLGSVLH